MMDKKINKLPISISDVDRQVEAILALSDEEVMLAARVIYDDIDAEIWKARRMISDAVAESRRKANVSQGNILD